MADQRLSALQTALALNDDDWIYIVSGGISKKIEKTVFLDAVMLKANNLNDVADPSVALANIGGLTSQEIEDTINTLLLNYYDSLLTMELIGREYSDAVNDSFGGGIIVSGLQYSVSGSLTNISEGMVVLRDSNGVDRIYYVPASTQSNTVTPITYFAVVEDDVYNNNSVNAGKIRRGTVVVDSNIGNRSHVFVNFGGGSTSIGTNRYIDWVSNNVIESLTPRKIMIPQTSLGQNLTLDPNNPLGVLVYPNNEVQFFGGVLNNTAATLNFQTTLITDLTTDLIPLPSASIYGSSEYTTKADVVINAATNNQPANPNSLFRISGNSLIWVDNNRLNYTAQEKFLFSGIRYQS